jgi:hypothetical protein
MRGHFFDLSFGLRPSEELYDLRTDPSGVNNLASDLGFTATIDSLRSKMVAMLKEEADPRILGNGTIFDTYKYAGGRAKAYDTWLKEQEEKGLLQVPASETDTQPHKSNKGPRTRTPQP